MLHEVQLLVARGRAEEILAHDRLFLPLYLPFVVHIRDAGLLDERRIRLYTSSLGDKVQAAASQEATMAKTERQAKV